MAGDAPHAGWSCRGKWNKGKSNSPTDPEGYLAIPAFEDIVGCRFAFVAHREEILKQALRTYREVLRDHAFGELLVGGVMPDCFDHLFATIDNMTPRDLLGRCGADYWYTVAVDECHRLSANRFHAFVTTVCPLILLGLTATPECSNGKPAL